MRNRKGVLLAAMAAVVLAGCEAGPAPKGGPAASGGAAARPAPEVKAEGWLNSEPLTLGGLRGKVVVVEFWATWCPPCRRSIPHLNELFKTYSPRGVVFMGLSDEPRAAVEPFAKEIGILYPVGYGSPSGGAYGVQGIPRAFLVDAAGNIAWEGHPMDGLDAALEARAPK